MGLSRKRKQQLSQMSARATKSHKHRKIDRENERKRRFLRKQREEDFWDEYEEPRSESSSDESPFEDSSLDGTSSEEDNLDGGKTRGDNTCEGLGEDDDGGVRLRVEERIFRLVWKDKAGDYLRGIKGCGLSATDKREKRCIRELEKSASQTSSIVDMFSIQRDRNESHNTNLTSDSVSASSPITPNFIVN